MNLQCNIYSIHKTENSLEHVVPVASHHRHVRLRACSTVCVSGRQRAAFIRNPAAYVTSHTLSISTIHADGHVYHDCQSPSTISTSDPVSTSKLNWSNSCKPC